MVTTINTQDIRNLNLFGKITRVNTKFCLKYNNGIVFCVPKRLVQKAVSGRGENIREVSRILGKRVKVVPSPGGIWDAENFIRAIVSPVTFKDLEVKNNEIIITTKNINKAALIGRNKRRFLEMKKIVRDYFGKDFRIV